MKKYSSVRNSYQASIQKSNTSLSEIQEQKDDNVDGIDDRIKQLAKLNDRIFNSQNKKISVRRNFQIQKEINTIKSSLEDIRLDMKQFQSQQSQNEISYTRYQTHSSQTERQYSLQAEKMSQRRHRSNFYSSQSKNSPNPKSVNDSQVSLKKLMLKQNSSLWLYMPLSKLFSSTYLTQITATQVLVLVNDKTPIPTKTIYNFRNPLHTEPAHLVQAIRSRSSKNFIFYCMKGSQKGKILKQFLKQHELMNFQFEDLVFLEKSSPLQPLLTQFYAQCKQGMSMLQRQQIYKQFKKMISDQIIKNNQNQKRQLWVDVRKNLRRNQVLRFDEIVICLFANKPGIQPQKVINVESMYFDLIEGIDAECQTILCLNPQIKQQKDCLQYLDMIKQV